MSATEYGQFQYGGVPYPLTAATTNSLLQDADPAIYWVTQFYKQCLQTHIEARLVAEATACGVPIPVSVGSTTSFELGPFVSSTWRDQRFPILSVYRKASTQKYFTAGWMHVLTDCEVSYILPHLSQVQATRLLPILHAIELMLMQRTDVGMDPTFNAGAPVCGAAYADLQSLELMGPSSYGILPGNEQTFYQIWKCKLIITERVMSTTITLPLMNGIDAGIDLVTTGNANFSDIVDVKT